MHPGCGPLVKLRLSSLGSVAYLIPTKKKGSSFNSTQESPQGGTVDNKRNMRLWDSSEPYFTQGVEITSLL